MEDKKGNTRCDADSESVYEHQGGQTSIREQQLTADEKFSEKDVREKLKSAPELSPSSSSGYSSPSYSKRILDLTYEGINLNLRSLNFIVPHLESEISTLEKQITANEKFPEKDVQNKLPNKSVLGLSPYSSSGYSSPSSSKRNLDSTYERINWDLSSLNTVLGLLQSQISTLGKQMTVDETFSEDDVQDKLPIKSVPGLSHYSSSGYSSPPSSKTVLDLTYERKNQKLRSVDPILPRLEIKMTYLQKQLTADEKFSEKDVREKLKSAPELSPSSSSGYSSPSYSKRILDLTYEGINLNLRSLNFIVPHLESEISTLEKQITANEKFPEKDVQDKLPNKSVLGLSPCSSSGYSSPSSSKRNLDSTYERINWDLSSLNTVLGLLQSQISTLGKQMTVDEKFVSGSYQSLHEKSDLRDLGAGPSSAQTSYPGVPIDLIHYSIPIPKTELSWLVLAADSHLQQPFDGSPVNSPVSSSSYKQKKGNWRSYRRMKKSKTHFTAPVTDSSDDTLDQPPPDRLTETVSIKSSSSAADVTPGANQDKTPEMELHATADPSSIQLSPKDGDCSESASPEKKIRKSSSSDEMFGDIDPNSIFQLPVRKDTDDGGPSFYTSSTVSTEESGAQDAFKLLSVQSESDTGDVSDAPVEMDASLTAENYSATNTLPTRSHLQTNFSDPGSSKRDSSCLSRSHSVPSLSLTTSADNKTFTRAKSLPDMLFKNSFEEFTPDITADENDESYRFQCSCPGLYQCSVTGLLFHMDGEGDVVYRIVPWDRRLLGQHHKQPAGPLFDIKCVQQSMCQLHLPHCEIRSTGGCGFLSVAHVNDDSIEFIAPHKITETDVIINITGFSGFGNVKDEDSPPDPVRAKVLLFYRPPADLDPDYFLNVLLLPRNVVLRDVLRTRKKLFGEESLIQTSPHCKLHPKQEYKLSTCPEDDSVLVEPTEAEFDCDDFDYFPTFQVSWQTVMNHINLFLRETKTPHSVWERRVCLSPSAVKRCVQGSSDERLLDIRSSFIDGISGPVLKSLLDKLFEKTVLTDSERESADEIQNKSDKARFVIDTVRKKGEAAGSEMIDFLCEVDPFLSEHLGLI